MQSISYCVNIGILDEIKASMYHKLAPSHLAYKRDLQLRDKLFKKKT